MFARSRPTLIKPNDVLIKEMTTNWYECHSHTVIFFIFFKFAMCLDDTNIFAIMEEILEPLLRIVQKHCLNMLKKPIILPDDGQQKTALL